MRKSPTKSTRCGGIRHGHVVDERLGLEFVGAYGLGDFHAAPRFVFAGLPEHGEWSFGHFSRFHSFRHGIVDGQCSKAAANEEHQRGAGGGYASGPTLKAAQRAGVPTLLQEQNSYAGVTNKLSCARGDGGRSRLRADPLWYIQRQARFSFPCGRRLRQTEYGPRATSIAFGIMLSVARHAVRITDTKADERHERDLLGRRAFSRERPMPTPVRPP